MAEVDTDALRADANDGWQQWSLDLEGWGSDAVAATLTEADFSFIPGADDVSAAFIDARQELLTYLETGAEVFEGFARALLETAEEYLRAEGASQAEIDAVEREEEGL